MQRKQPKARASLSRSPFRQRKLRLRAASKPVAASDAEAHDWALLNNSIDNLLAGTGIATVFVDRQSRILRFTPLAGQLIALDDSSPGQRLAELKLNTPGYDTLAEDTQQVLNTRQPLERQVQSGKGHWFTLRIRPYRTLARVPVGAVLTFVDITEAHRIQEVLRENERFLRESQKVAGIASYITDLSTGVWKCSPEMHDIFGIDENYPHTLEGWAAFLHPDTKDELFAYHLMVEREQLRFDYEYKIIRINDGAVRWVHGLGDLEYEDGRPARRIGTIQDITERKQAEEELSIAAVAFEAQNAIIITDLDGRILDVNPGAVERYGYSRDELLYMSARELAPAGLEERSLEELEQGLLSRLPIERTSRRKDGSEIQEEVVLRPFVLQGRSCVLASVRDISERVRTQERLQLQLQRLKALRTIDVMITSNLDIRLTLDVLLDQVIAQLAVDAAAILLFNEGLQTLEYAAGRGFRSREIEQSRLRLGQGYAGQAGLERRLVLMPNLRESGATGFVRSGLLAAESFVSYAGVPLVAKGRLVGVLEVFHRSPIAIDIEWRDFLETLAGQAAIALDDAHLFSDLQRSNTELRLAYDATIEGWSRAMDLRDKETEGHTQRVTELTVTLARAAGMTGDQIAHVRRGSLLHDIGKLGVPDRILLKADALTDEEWATMRMHPQYAYDMLSSIDYLRPALDIPYCHHEKWDGTGYPRGLKGEQIPLAARIFMVADVWDALRSDRPYRVSWSEERVRAHIRDQAGSHFDPKAVDLFFQVIPVAQRGKWGEGSASE